MAAQRERANTRTSSVSASLDTGAASRPSMAAGERHQMGVTKTRHCWQNHTTTHRQLAASEAAVSTDSLTTC